MDQWRSFGARISFFLREVVQSCSSLSVECSCEEVRQQWLRCIILCTIRIQYSSSTDMHENGSFSNAIMCKLLELGTWCTQLGQDWRYGICGRWKDGADNPYQVGSKRIFPILLLSHWSFLSICISQVTSKLCLWLSTIVNATSKQIRGGSHCSQSLRACQIPWIRAQVFWNLIYPASH